MRAFRCFTIFLLRLSGKEDFLHDQLQMLPVVEGAAALAIEARALRLVCVTSHYAALWGRNAARVLRNEGWTNNDSRLTRGRELAWTELPPDWEHGCALRSDFARRQALLEIDVLAAVALGLTLDELETIYRIQFPVMRQYEDADEYDTEGYRLPNTTRKDPGGKEVRDARKAHDGIAPLTVSWKIDNGRSVVTRTFHPPFTRVEREEDYRRTWTAFAARFAAQ